MTKSEYADYQDRVARFFEVENLRDLSVDMDDRYEFSHKPCEVCLRHYSGARYLAHGITHEMEVLKHAGEPIEYRICEDCMYYHEYGQLDDQTMGSLEE